MKTGLVGWPLGHSFSPAIHNLAYQMAGLTGEYELFPIEPQDDLALQKMVELTRSGKVNGFNITIPHKVNILRYLDDVLPIAKSVGAVNTVLNVDGRVLGTNTDAPGFFADLKNQLGEGCLASGRALVFGSGGSAKAVIYSLLSNNVDVTVCARNIEKAENDLDSFRGSYPNRLNIIELQKCGNTHFAEHQLFINTTPLGMYPKVDDSIMPAGSVFPPNSYVYDLVYNPPETKFVSQAKEQGCHAVTGFGMLVEQALLAFELWTNVTIDRAEFYKRYKELERSN